MRTVSPEKQAGTATRARAKKRTSEPDSASGLDPFVASVTRRVGSLAEEIDGVIAGIREDAAAMAGSDAADEEQSREVQREFEATLIDHVTGLRQHCDDLLNILEWMTTELAASGGEDGKPRSMPADVKETALAGGGTAGVPEEAIADMRLLVTQMALSGASRGEIVERLRTEFGVARPEALVDDISAR